MATTTNLGEVFKAAKPDLALALQQVAQQRPPTRREREAITQFLTLPPRQQNAVVTTQLGRQGKLAATNPTVRRLGQFLFYDDTRVQTARAAPKQTRRTNTRRDDSITTSAPPVRPTPMSEQPGRPHDDNTNHVIAQALHQLVQQRQNRGAITTNGGQWRSVPQY